MILTTPLLAFAFLSVGMSLSVMACVTASRPSKSVILGGAILCLILSVLMFLIEVRTA